MADAAQKTAETDLRLHEIKRSNVRVYVTYWVTFAYVVVAAFIVIWLIAIEGRIDLALGVFSGLSGVASSIIGYWFGSRGHGGLQGQKETQNPGPIRDEAVPET